MTHHKKSKIGAVVVASAALVVGGSAAAFAASSYNVTAGSAPAGTVVNWTANTTGSGTNEVTFEDVDALGGVGVTLNCDTASATGTVTVNDNQDGAGIGQILGTDWTHCTGPFSTSFTVQGNGTWDLNATGDTDANGTTDGTITGIDADVSGSCSFTVTNSAPLDANWTNGTGNGTLDVPGTDADLVLSNVSGLSCSLLGISDGDHATFNATYSVGADTPADNPIHINSNS